MRRGQHNGGRARTILDLRWPDIPEYTELARTWSEDAVNTMLTALWCGYDTLVAEVFVHIDITEADAELERVITQLLEPHIRRHLSGNEPYDVQHGPYEYATRQPAPAQPPEYDLAFFLRHNPRIMWPVEAKFLRSDGAVDDYVRGVRENFLTGRYAPYVNSGAMLGYLLHGSPQRVFYHIARSLSCQLLPHPTLTARQHRVSDHFRDLVRADFASGSFLCHHLIMDISRAAQKGQRKKTQEDMPLEYPKRRKPSSSKKKR